MEDGLVSAKFEGSSNQYMGPKATTVLQVSMIQKSHAKFKTLYKIENVPDPIDAP